MHVDNKNKDILILGEGPTQRLDDTTLTTEAKYPINFIQPKKDYTLCLDNISKDFTTNNMKKSRRVCKVFVC